MGNLNLVFFQKEDCDVTQVLRFFRNLGYSIEDYSHDFMELGENSWLSQEGTYQQGVKWELVDATEEEIQKIKEEIEKSNVLTFQ